MSRWYEHPCTNKLLEGDQVLTVLSFLNEAKNAFINKYGDPNSKVAPLENILKMWPDKSSVKKEWLRRVLDNGPMNDKIQSMGSVISEFPMHSLFYLDHLISLVNMSKKRSAIISSDLLAKIFVTFLLPKTRPLINLNERPLASLIELKNKNSKKTNGVAVREKILCYWYFEEQMKTRYNRFIKALEELIKNEPDKVNKIKIVNLCFKLCQTKESQSLIIDILVNKLGDKNKKVTGTAFSKLSDLGMGDHVLMPKIVRSVRKFVFRPNLTKKAQYYAVQLLARLKINKKHLEAEPIDEENGENDESEIKTNNIAIEMIQIYIGIFKRLIDSTSTKCEKLYSALMAGLSRALPFAKGAEVQKYANSIFKLVHSTNLNLAIQGLKVLHAVVMAQRDASVTSVTGSTDTDNSDRYFRLVHATLLNPAVFFNSQKVALIDVIFKSLAADNDTTRVKAIVKRLLQLCLHHPEPGFICVVLLFLSRLTTGKHKAIFSRPVASVGSLAASEVKVPTIPGADAAVDSDSGDEEVPDVVSDDEMMGKSSEKHLASSSVSWVHRKSDAASSGEFGMLYDPLARNPKFANADKERLEELDMLAAHYHPSVRIFVDKVTHGERITYNSDPSEDMSLTKFLDRFSYKNPKQVEDKRKQLPGTSRPVAAAAVRDEARTLPVNSKQFADLSADKVPRDQLFFHKYFNHAKTNGLAKSANDNDEIDSDFADSDTEFDKYITKANLENEDELNLSGSDMGDLDDEEVEFSDYEDDDLDLELEGDDDKMSVDGEGDELYDDMDELDESAGDHEHDDDVDLDASEDVSDDDEEDEPTIHSSKRRRLGAELSQITTGALTIGKTFDTIKDKAANKIKCDRRRRKANKHKVNTKVKMTGKRKSKK